MIKLDDFLTKKKEPAQVLDLSRVKITSKEEFKKHFDKIPECKVKPEKVAAESVKIKDKDFSFFSGKKEGKQSREWNYLDPVPPDMKAIKLEDICPVNIDWKMLTPCRPKSKVEEDIFSRLVQLGKLDLKYQQSLLREKSSDWIRKTKNPKSSIVEMRVLSCRECCEDFCDGSMCSKLMYDCFFRPQPVTSAPSQSLLLAAESGEKKRKKRKKKKGKRKARKRKNKSGRRKLGKNSIFNRPVTRGCNRDHSRSRGVIIEKPRRRVLSSTRSFSTDRTKTSLFERRSKSAPRIHFECDSPDWKPKRYDYISDSGPSQSDYSSRSESQSPTSHRKSPPMLRLSGRRKPLSARVGFPRRNQPGSAGPSHFVRRCTLYKGYRSDSSFPDSQDEEDTSESSSPRSSPKKVSSSVARYPSTVQIQFDEEYQTPGLRFPEKMFLPSTIGNKRNKIKEMNQIRNQYLDKGVAKVELRLSGESTDVCTYEKITVHKNPLAGSAWAAWEAACDYRNMSYKTYNQLWGETQKNLDEAIQSDTILQTAKPQKDRAIATQVVSELYVKYITTVNNLDQCYDQILQPQKRIIIRKLLDASIGRTLELKQELVNLEMSEFSYFDNVLLHMNLLPQEVELRVPVYYKRERESEIKRRRETVDEILKKLGYLEEEEAEVAMTVEEAIRLIQVHERARQGRLRSQFMKEIRQMKEKSKPETMAEVQSSSNLAAVLRIQKTWRGYIARRKVLRRKLEEMLLIGMVHPNFIPQAARKRATEVEELRRRMQEKYQADFEKLNLMEKEQIRKNKEGKMMEEMADEIRAWFINFKNQTGKFPEIPTEESGGSAMLFRSSSRQGTESSLSKSTGGSSERSKKSKGKGSPKEEKKKDEDEEEDPGFKMAPSNFLNELLTSNMEFDAVWRDRLHDRSELPYLDMIQAEKEAEVEAEVRKIVDKMMRQELEVLQAALDRDRAKKGKKGKRSTKKKGRRGGKKSKKKKEKDLTPDRTLESLFEELVTNGIIKKYPEVSISAFKGERSYANFELRQQGKDPLPALGDIRQVITEYCILPLGSKTVHQNSPLIRSLLIAGPHASGKNMLVHAICTEVGAVLFDLSPANIVGKYPGKSGLIMLMHLVSKVSRLMQPAVIYMNGAEKPFMKKVPKTDKTDPKRLKKDLPKLVKGIGPEDQIMLIGVSSTPWDCDQKALQQTYGKFILIPRPDYSSLSFLYMELLFQYSGVSRQFDIGAMAKLSDGYTVGSIIESVKEVMTCKRVLQLVVQPLNHYELINALSKRTPVYKEEEEAFVLWLSKTPIGRKKAKYFEMLREKELLEQKAKGTQ